MHTYSLSISYTSTMPCMLYKRLGFISSKKFVTSNTLSEFLSRHCAIKHQLLLTTSTAKLVTHLNDAAVTVSYRHVISDGQTFEMLDKAALQVTTVTCLHCCVHQTLATPPAFVLITQSHFHAVKLLTCFKSHVQFHASHKPCLTLTLL